MKHKPKYYWMYIYHNDIYLAKFKTKNDNLQELSKYLSDQIIRSGMEKGYKISQQIFLHTHFADMIAKQRQNCQKVRRSDIDMLLHSHMSLLRFGAISSDNFLFLKKKITKSKNGINLQTKVQ